MADTTITYPAPVADAAPRSDDPLGELTAAEIWLTQAHAPGDPVPPECSHADVGTD
jgi:hypothetical protein